MVSVSVKGDHRGGFIADVIGANCSPTNEANEIPRVPLDPLERGSLFSGMCLLSDD